MEDKKTSDKRLWLGILIVAIGSVWLLDNLRLIPYYISDVIISFGSLFTVIGLFLLFVRRKIEAGLIFTVIGVFLILDDYYYINFRDIWHIFWPAIVIIIGASLILRRNQTKLNSEKKNDVDYINDFAVFGGGDRTVDSQEFKGGKITAIFGGSNIELGHARLAEGRHELDLFILFGGTEIRVPADWSVQVEVFSILGGFSDKRKSSVQVVPEPNKVLVVKGFVMFGGGDIKLA
ncbi:MAG: DUF5668 domain-containing protein [Bacteroidota bacterium]